MSEEHGSDLHAERADHYGSEKPAGKSMIKGLATVFLGLVVIGGALGGAGYWFYNQGQPIQDDGNLPILLPDPSPIKIRPEDPGGMEVPHRETTVYDQLSDVDPDANVVLQELPDMPRAPEAVPTAKAQGDDETTETVEESSMEETVQQVQESQGLAADTVVEAPEIDEPDLTDAEKAVAAAKSRTNETAAAEQVEAAKEEPAPAEQEVADAGAFRVQLASVREEAGAAAEWKRLSSKNKDLLGNLEMFVQRIDIEGKGVFYRLQAGPLGDAGAAEKLCADLKERSVGCLIVRP
ncbi:MULTISPECIES: SPOR domain-containing protein [Thalassospira]|uniref:Energy transducer TonB n=1 Tax=Thalassospira profundimaris TaxID=502049 RepID=A0A367V846_9PROT|nr:MULTISPECIES: SPOR domain-containing protein [Thalassospira]KZB72964.1 energy transducer TonB [Thalassospira sp. MCCC 1A01148]MBR9900189.1 SPOR domain-containing protein [Rhodospirillales bacterium]RCK20661.1 energy transducer TonB [Thalassospira profundimaris]